MIHYFALNPPTGRRRGRRTGRKRRFTAKARRAAMRNLRKARAKLRRRAGKTKNRKAKGARPGRHRRSSTTKRSHSMARRRKARGRRRRQTAAQRRASIRNLRKARAKRRHNPSGKKRRRRRRNPDRSLLGVPAEPKRRRRRRKSKASKPKRRRRGRKASKRRHGRRRHRRMGHAKSKLYRPGLRPRRRITRTQKRHIRKLGIRMNPGRSLSAIKSEGTRLLRLDTWTGVAEGVAGFSVALSLPIALAKAAKRPWLNQGAVGVASSALSSVVGGVVAGWISERAKRNVLAGGLVATGIKLVAWLAPQIARKLIPMDSAPMPMPLPAPSAGTAGFLTMSGMDGIDGGVMTADELIAGESGSLSNFLDNDAMAQLTSDVGSFEQTKERF